MTDEKDTNEEEIEETAKDSEVSEKEVDDSEVLDFEFNEDGEEWDIGVRYWGQPPLFLII